MDPLSAVSLAGNIIQFVDFGIRVVSKGYQIYKSNNGALAEDRELEVVINDLLVLQAKIQCSVKPAKSEGEMPELNKSLEDLSTESSELAGMLLKRLNMAKAQGKRRIWKSLRQALKSVWSKREVDDMAKRLLVMKEQLQMRILVALRYGPDDAIMCSRETQQRMFRETLDSHVLQQSKEFESLDQTSKKILQALQVTSDVFVHENSEDCNKPKTIKHNSTQSTVANGENIIAAMGQLAERFRNIERQKGLVRSCPVRMTPEDFWPVADGIIRSFSFPGMTNRHEAVASAHTKTFTWIFEHAGTAERCSPWGASFSS